MLVPSTRVSYCHLNVRSHTPQANPSQTLAPFYRPHPPPHNIAGLIHLALLAWFFWRALPFAHAPKGGGRTRAQARVPHAPGNYKYLAG